MSWEGEISSGMEEQVGFAAAVHDESPTAWPHDICCPVGSVHEIAELCLVWWCKKVNFGTMCPQNAKWVTHMLIHTVIHSYSWFKVNNSSFYSAFSLPSSYSLLIRTDSISVVHLTSATSVIDSHPRTLMVVCHGVPACFPSLITNTFTSCLSGVTYW